VKGVWPILLGQRGLGTHASHKEDGIHLGREGPSCEEGKVGSIMQKCNSSI
jgi:hypothetical protein